MLSRVVNPADFMPQCLIAFVFAMLRTSQVPRVPSESTVGEGLSLERTSQDAKHFAELLSVGVSPERTLHTAHCTLT